jgi:hypothetical protein
MRNRIAEIEAVQELLTDIQFVLLPLELGNFFQVFSSFFTISAS